MGREVVGGEEKGTTARLIESVAGGCYGRGDW